MKEDTFSYEEERGGEEEKVHLETEDARTHKAAATAFLPPEGKVLDRLGHFVNELERVERST